MLPILNQKVKAIEATFIDAIVKGLLRMSSQQDLYRHRTGSKQEPFDSFKVRLYMKYLWQALLYNFLGLTSPFLVGETYEAGGANYQSINSIGQRADQIRNYAQDHQRAHEVVSLGESGLTGLWITHQQPQALGTLVLVHGIEQHPDWPHLIQSLRLLLPEKGWNTLSLLTPFNAENTLDETYAYLENRSASQPYVLITHKESTFHLVGKPLVTSENTQTLDTRFAGFIFIDALFPWESYHAVNEALVETEPPLLDIISQATREDIILQAKDRKASLSRRKRPYFQWHSHVPWSYQKVDDRRLVKIVRGWLRRMIAKKPIPILTESVPEREL